MTERKCRLRHVLVNIVKLESSMSTNKNENECQHPAKDRHGVDERDEWCSCCGSLQNYRGEWERPKEKMSQSNEQSHKEETDSKLVEAMGQYIDYVLNKPPSPLRQMIIEWGKRLEEQDKEKH